MAKTIAEKLAAKLTGKEEQAHLIPANRQPSGTRALPQGALLLEQRTGDDLKRAADYFTKATVADPNYALANAGLADAYVLMPGLGAGTPAECFPKAEAAARRALQLEENLAEAHTSLGCVLVYYHLDFAQANTEYKRAIALNPNYAPRIDGTQIQFSQVFPASTKLSPSLSGHLSKIRYLSSYIPILPTPIGVLVALGRDSVYCTERWK